VNEVIIPDIDAIPLPAPIWLLRFLLNLTFILHIVPMNIVLGGGILTVALAWYARKKNRDDMHELALHMSNVLPAAAAFTITLGVPPLLFVQVLYGPLFYTGAVLIAWFWLSVIALLLVGYYGYYWFSIKRDAEGKLPIWAGIIASIMFLAISFLYTNKMTLMIQPEKFAPMHHAEMQGFLLNAADPLVWPRWLHMLVGAIAVASLVVMLVGLVFHKKRPDYGCLAIRTGGMIFVVTTLLQLAVGVWHLLTLRSEVMWMFLGRDVVATSVLGVATLLALVAMVLVLIAARGKAVRGMTIAGAVVLAVVLVLMATVRSIVRDAYLIGKYDVTAQPTDPNWVVVVLFLALMLGGIGIVSWMTHAVVTRRGAEHTAL